MATQELGILIRAQGAAQASAQIKGVGQSVNTLSGHASAFAANLKTNVGNALSTFGGRLKQAATGIAAFAGIGGILGLGGAIEQSLSKAQDWGLAIEKLGPITGDTAEQLSGLLAVTEKYGISTDRFTTLAGFAEKAVEAIGLKAKGAAAFQKQYGFSVVDSSGHVKDFSTLLSTFSDYYRTNTDRAQADAAAAKLFGRGFADLVPVLALGSKGIADATDEAKALGLTLTADNVQALAAARDATRKWGDAIGGLELQLGLTLLPMLSKLANWGTTFVEQHGKDITKFFGDLATFAENAAGTIGNLVGAAARFWGGLPSPLRDLLVKGIVADRTVKFLFGFSPIGSIVSGIQGAFSAAVGKTLGSGIAQTLLGGIQKVFVVNMGAGGMGGGPNLPAAAEDAAGAAAVGEGAATVGIGTMAGVLAAPLALALAPYLVAAMLPRNPANFTPTSTTPGFNALVASRPGFGTNPASVAASLAGPGTGGMSPDERQAAQDTLTAGFAFSHAAQAIIPALNRTSAVFANAPWLAKLEASWTKAGQTMHDKITDAIKGLSGKNAGAAAAFLGTHLGNAGFGAGGYDQAVKIIAELKALNSNDPRIVAAIKELTARLPRLKTDKADLAAALKEANSTDPKNEKLTKLNALMADLKEHGDRTAQKKLGDVINAVRHQKLNVNVKAYTNVSIRDVAGATVTRRIAGSGSTGVFLD